MDKEYIGQKPHEQCGHRNEQRQQLADRPGTADTATIVDAINNLANQTRNIADAVTPLGAGGGTDATGGCVTSLTEAVMGVTGAGVRIAGAIESLAGAIREHGQQKKE